MWDEWTAILSKSQSATFVIFRAGQSLKSWNKFSKEQSWNLYWFYSYCHSEKYYFCHLNSTWFNYEQSISIVFIYLLIKLSLNATEPRMIFPFQNWQWKCIANCWLFAEVACSVYIYCFTNGIENLKCFKPGSVSPLQRWDANCSPETASSSDHHTTSPHCQQLKIILWKVFQKNIIEISI